MCKIVVKVTEKEQQGMRLEQLRNNLKLNQKTFAKALGISQGYLSQILLDLGSLYGNQAKSEEQQTILTFEPHSKVTVSNDRTWHIAGRVRLGQ